MVKEKISPKKPAPDKSVSKKVVKEAPVKKQAVKEAKPVKEVKKAVVEKTIPKRRILTAEGWKRARLKELKKQKEESGKKAKKDVA